MGNRGAKTRGLWAGSAVTHCAQVAEGTFSLNNNNRNNRRRGRGNRNNQGGGSNQNRIDSRARGNAPQLLDKYKKLAQDAQHNGDRVQMEYYLQFADHYFRVIADNKARQDEARGKRGDERGQANDDSDDYDDDGENNRHQSSRRSRGRRDEEGDQQDDDQGQDFDNEVESSSDDQEDRKTQRRARKAKAESNGSDGDKPKRRKPRVAKRNDGERDQGGIDSAVLPPSIGGAPGDDSLEAVG